MSGMQQLVKLELSSNQMTGPIPSWFASFANLETLSLDQNKFNGTLPNVFTGPKIKTLGLVDNQFVGFISKALCDGTEYISADCEANGEVQCAEDCCSCCSVTECQKRSEEEN